MGLGMPEVHDITVEVDGQTFEGAWWVSLNDMIVWYNGYGARTAQQSEGANEIALKMLEELVREHFIPLNSVPLSLPPAVRETAHNYLNSMDDQQLTAKLIRSFGSSVVGSQAHRQVARVLINALGMVVQFWKDMCDDDVPEKTFNDLRQWMSDSSHPVDWQNACKPSVAKRNGVQVVDCDACRLVPIADAVAQTARYLQSANTESAVEALCSVAGAWDEGCHFRDVPDRFEKWIVYEVLPFALECRQLEYRSS